MDHQGPADQTARALWVRLDHVDLQGNAAKEGHVDLEEHLGHRGHVVHKVWLGTMDCKENQALLVRRVPWVLLDKWALAGRLALMDRWGCKGPMAHVVSLAQLDHREWMDHLAQRGTQECTDLQDNQDQLAHLACAGRSE